MPNVTETRRNVGRRIADLRAASNLTQRELAASLTAAGTPTTHQTVSQWEKGQTVPSLSRLLAVADRFDLTAADLLEV